MIERHPNPRLWIEVRNFLFTALTVYALAATLWAIDAGRMPS